MKYYYHLVILLLFYYGKAQTITDSYHIKWVNDLHGLTNLNVSNAILDDKGFLWIATDLGLFKYDGYSVEEVRNSNYPQLNYQRIINLFKDNNSKSIYFNTFPEDKSYSIENGSVRQLGHNEGVMFDQFFLNKKSPFFKAYAKAYSKVEKKYSISIQNQALTTQDKLYIKEKDKIIILKKDGTYSTIQNHLKTGYIIFNIQNTVFHVGYNKIKIINGDSKKNYLKLDKVTQELINNQDYYLSFRSIIKSNHINYLNINSKIYQINYENNTLSSTFLFELNDKNINKFSFSQKENIYFIGTVNLGVVIFYKNDFNTVSVENNNVEYTLVQKGTNTYSYNGWVLNNRTKKISLRERKKKFANFRFLLPYNGDYFHQLADNRLVSIIDLKTISSLDPSKMPFLTGFTHINKTLWLSNPKNAARVVNNQIQIDPFVAPHLSENHEINAISSKDDQLIFATTEGVFFHKPFTKQFRYIKGLEKVNARYIKHLDKNSFWVGCYGEGLFLVYKNKTFKVTDTNNEIKTTHAIEEDKYGNLWIATNNGLLTVIKQKAIKNILNNIPIECYLYTTEDGLPTNEFNGGSTFPSINSNGEIGFPSMQGYVWFLPEKIKKNIFYGDIVINKLVVNNKLIEQQKNNDYKIPANANIIGVSLKYGYYFNSKNITAYYKFKDQKKWSKIELNNFQIPRYNSGVQILQIKIHTHGTDNKFDVVKSFKIDFQQRYYESYWFWIFVFIMFAIIIFVAYTIGAFILNRNKIILEKKIEERTIILLEALSELEESKKSLNQTLVDKDMLLKEVHHRVKNNLQLIMSMFKIQARRKNYDSIFDFLNKGESRINAMALIHQKLYQVDETLNRIDLRAYIKDLTDSIDLTFNDNEKEVIIDLDCYDIMVNLSTAIPIGLIINELLINSIKHAFQNNEKGIIMIGISKLQNNQFNLTVEDNGVGFDKELNNQNSFGLELINLLVQQLKGSIILDSYNKTKYSIFFYEIDIQTGDNTLIRKLF